MKKKLKRGMSGLLAALLTFTAVFGSGVTALAASPSGATSNPTPSLSPGTETPTRSIPRTSGATAQNLYERLVHLRVHHNHRPLHGQLRRSGGLLH